MEKTVITDNQRIASYDNLQGFSSSEEETP